MTVPFDSASGPAQTHPASSRRTIVSITRMPSSLSLRHGQRGEAFAAGGAEIVGVLDADLLQRLEAIGDEAGRQHGDPLDPFSRQRLHGFGRVRLQPLGAPEPRLKRQAQTILLPALALAIWWSAASDNPAALQLRRLVDKSA